MNRMILSAAVAMAMVGCASGGDEAAAVANDSVSAKDNAVVETIMARRSVRKYKDRAVEREKLETLVQCGINAPSGMNKQPWQVRVVDNADYINGISELFKASNPKMAQDPEFKNMFRNATAVIFVASPKDGSGQLDCGMLGENIMVAAPSLGLGTCCLGAPVAWMKSNEAAAPYVQRLDIPEDYELLYAIGVGYPDEEPAAKPRDAERAKFVD
jgi:nitroreductase